MARHLSEEARDKMVAAAQDVIADLGVEGFTVDEVARRSGVAKTTIYRHFNNSNALAIHALDCMIVEFPEVDTGSLAGDLNEYLATILPHMNEPAMRQTMAGFLAVSADEPEFGRVHAAMLAERMAPLKMAFKRAIARGEIDAEIDVDLAIALFEGSFIFRRILLDEYISTADADAVVGMVVRALGVQV